MPGLLSGGFDPEILYFHTIRPLDTELLLESLQKTRRAVVIEEHMENGGLEDDIIRLAKDIGVTDICSLSIPNKLITGYGSYRTHLQFLQITPESLVKKVFEKFTSSNIEEYKCYEYQRTTESNSN